MTRLFFQYSMKLFYSEPVNPCHFTIKCIPANTKRQSLKKINIEMDPRADYSYSSDGFGNDKIIGALRQPHDHYYLTVSGEVEITQLLYEEEDSKDSIGVYRYSFGKTRTGKKIREYAENILEEITRNGIVNDYDRSVYIMHELHKYLEYQPDITDVDTTAEEAFALGKGVCQDFAHIYLCIARSVGIPARYVTGLMIGEGASHAWVEVLCKDKWIGLDPTNDLLIDDNYIKLGHGRDAGDCRINLGIMRGGGNQRQEIEVKVWKDNVK